MADRPASSDPSHPQRPAPPQSQPLSQFSISQSEADPERHDLSSPRAPSPREQEAPAPPPSEEVTKLRLAAHYAALVPMAFIGVLVRLGLEALADYDGAVVFNLIWAQAVGCLVMGNCLHLKSDITMIYPPLYSALTTGLAGSITTFSSWMLYGYLSFANFSKYNRNGLYNTVDGFAYTFATLLVSASCLRAGEYLASLWPKALRYQSPDTSRLRRSSSSVSGKAKAATLPAVLRASHSPTPGLDTLTILFASLCYVAAILIYFLGPSHWRHDVTFPLLLGPPGAMLRFALAKLNPKQLFVDRFPLGTLIANIVATLVLSGSFAASYRPGLLTGLGCNAMNGLEQGFCGCLSTVSTFMVEARTIRGWRWKLLYVGGSVVFGHVIVLAVVGGVGWAYGYGDVCAGAS